MTDETRFTRAEAHREFAKAANGRVWTLLAKENRTLREDDELLYAAHASCYHWLHVGTGVHHQRGEYLIAKVNVALHRLRPALDHAARCLELTEQHRPEMADFDIAFAFEGMARACALKGDKADARHYVSLAEAAGRAIQDAEDRQIFEDDLRGGDWFGLFEAE